GGSGPRSVRFNELVPLRGDVALPVEIAGPGIPVALDPYGPVFGDDPKVRAQASPLTHVRRGLPPFLILTAEHDLPSLAGMAEEFHQALRREGCDATLLKVEKRNHSSGMFSAISLDDAAARAILEFVKKHDGGR